MVTATSFGKIVRTLRIGCVHEDLVDLVKMINCNLRASPAFDINITDEADADVKL